MEKKKVKKATPKQTLVIVESPAKAKTIEKYLGRGYKVKASMGHIIDLPKSRLAIDTEGGYEPSYITIRGRAKLLNELCAEAKKSVRVLLASDNDREGEAIAWHLRNALQNKCDAKIERIVFNEITPAAIKQAVKEPLSINEAKVAAQKARRVLDRLVGYKLSPVLWSKVKGGLSAGRVQSVALRLICEREEEVERFIPEEYWSLSASLKKGRSHFTAKAESFDGKEIKLKSEKEALSLLNLIKGEKFIIESIKTSEKKVSPKPPFTTSTLQQIAANRLGFTSKKTMQLAQSLYEGADTKNGRVGLITYMRTDSTRISKEALREVRNFISENFPAALPETENKWSVKKGAQDAHEAIRPTFVSYTPASLKSYLQADALKLYSIIWERFVSSQMTQAVYESQTVNIRAGKALFRASESFPVKEGFLQALSLLSPKEGKRLPSLKEGDEIDVKELLKEQHFTQGPSRYSDASIVKVLEERGIGRPSTYAPIISVLLDRYYVTRSNKQLVPTVLGKCINKILVECFSDVVNVEFTANIENELDEVESEKLIWRDLIADFYPSFKMKVDEVMENHESVKENFDEETDTVCEKCGRKMVKKLGRYGYFLACPGFPECRNAKALPLAECPKKGCGGFIVERRSSARGRKFYGCTNYPACNFLTYYKPLEMKCPECGWFLVEKNDKKNVSLKACINPECRYLHSDDDESVK